MCVLLSSQSEIYIHFKKTHRSTSGRIITASVIESRKDVITSAPRSTPEANSMPFELNPQSIYIMPLTLQKSYTDHFDASLGIDSSCVTSILETSAKKSICKLLKS